MGQFKAGSLSIPAEGKIVHVQPLNIKSSTLQQIWRSHAKSSILRRACIAELSREMGKDYAARAYVCQFQSFGNVANPLTQDVLRTCMINSFFLTRGKFLHEIGLFYRYCLVVFPHPTR